MNDTMLQNLTYFEQAILFLLAFVAVYFVYLAIRDYRTSVNIRRLSGKCESYHRKIYRRYYY